MFLKNLSVVNYKNIESCDLSFSPYINCFVGDNGAGKTNLLDAIYYLSFTKSYFNTFDIQNIRYEQPFFMIKGQYLFKQTGEEVVSCSYQQDKSKSVTKNKKPYKRFADHIGLFPLVIITPLDSELIYEGSDIRRKYIDGVISQFDKVYLNHLLNYNKVLLQRNILLKQFAETNSFDDSMLSIYDHQLTEAGTYLYDKRKTFIEAYIPLFQKYYAYISGGKEQVSLTYQSHLHSGGFEELLSAARKKDMAARYTTAGIHKDDILFTIADNRPVKKFASQGQQKSFLVAMKLAQFDFIKNIKGFKPLLLFDDILDKLDYNRVEKMMTLVGGDNFGQIFITDTHTLRIAKIFKDIHVETRVFEVNKGNPHIIENL